MLAALLFAAALVATIAALARVLAGRPSEFRWTLNGQEPQWDCPAEWQCPPECACPPVAPLPPDALAEPAPAAPARLSLERPAESAGTRSG